MNMLRKLLLSLILICVIKCEQSFSYPVENLHAIIDRTVEYFKNISNAYKESNIDITKDIDPAIDIYMENTTKTIFQRQKRSVQNDLKSVNGVKVLINFEKGIFINLPDVQDIVFFSIQDGKQLLRFAAAIDSSNILLYQLADDKLQTVAMYPQSNGKRIIVNTYSTDMLMVVQKSTDGIVILRLGKNRNGTYELYFKQEFEISEVIHMNMWFGMNRLYLGVVSDARVFIYLWLGEHFDKIDTLYFKAKKLLSFQHKSFMHIVAIGSITKIFRFSVRSNKFVETQNLHGTRDANSFYFKEGHFEECFLALADNNSIILYKEMYDRFVPFQSFITTAHIFSLITESTVILLFVEDDTAEIYQYNGWRFLRLHEKLSNIRQIRQIRSYGEDALIVQDQNREWNLLKSIWTVKKTWQAMQNEINAWCFETKRRISQRNSVKLPDFKNPVKISNAHIGQLHVRNINNHNAKELIHLTQRYKEIITKLNSVNSTLVQALAVEKSKYIILHGKKISVKCRKKCHVRHIKSDTEIKPTKYKKLEHTNKILEFNSLKVKTMNNWKCPIPNFDLEDLLVKKSINGILMRNLQEETLKIFGDQTLSGEHIFLNLYATNISMPLNIATHNTTHTIRIKEAKVKELYLTENEFLLPLNVTTTTMTGSITAAKVRITGFVNLKGGISGKGREKLAPLKEIPVPLTLLKDCFLQNVTFRNVIKINNIIRTQGLSLKEILENSISLDSNIQEHIMLSSDKIQWENVTLLNHKNWVTKNSTDTIVIFGTKFANNIILTNFAYANIPTPKLTVPLCAIEVVAPEIRTSLITMDNLVIKNLNVLHVLGAYNLNNIIFDSMATLENIDFSTKLFTGQVFVHNILVSNIKGTDLIDKFHMNDWIGINRLQGPVNVEKLAIDNLRTPVIFNFSLPTIVRNLVIKADSEIGKINDVNVSSFMENVLKLNDIIFLEQVTFADGFRSDHVHASHSTLNLSHLDTHFNLHTKRIAKDLETNIINVPDYFDYFTSDISSTFIIQGSATFLTEPTVQNVQNMSIKRLSEHVWMSNKDSFISGSNMNIKNMTILADTYINEEVENSLNVQMWFNLSSRLFSKTKQQYITTISSFKNVKIPAIIATNNSVLHSSDPNVEDLLTNSLMRNITQIVKGVWHFEELDTGDLKLNNKLNDINLDTDIVRYEAKQNIVTGKKTITNLITENLWSYDNYFSHWANSALTQKGRKLPVIKGRKTFNNISLNNLIVKGTVNGRKIEDALLKSGNQTVYGIKRIQGHINAPDLIVNSTVNDVNLMQLMNIQVKKHKAVQIIDTDIDFQNGLNVFGNITVNGFYQGRELININNDQNKLNAILNRTTKITELAEDIKIALQNHAIYINKFEVIDENISNVTSHSETENVIALNNTCLCEPENISSFCNDTKLLNIMYGTNSSTFRMMKLIMLDDAVFVIMVASDFVSIYLYAPVEQQLYQKAELYVPNILQLSVEPADNSLWIILQLPEQTLILHYEIWNEFKQYILPSSEMLLTSKAPNNQLLLMRSDGIWNLGGVFHPKHISTIPLNGKIKTFAFDADYYIILTTENTTITLKSRYVGN